MTPTTRLRFKSWAMMTAAFVPAALLADFSAVALAKADAQLTQNEQVKRQFRIDPQSLVSALNEFGRQSGRDILFSTEVAGKKRSPGVNGAMTPEEALRTLLAGTGLAFRATNERTFLVEVADATPQGSSPPTTQSADATTTPDEKTSEEDRKVERVVVTGTHIRGKHPKSSPLQVYTAKDIERSGVTTTEQFIQKLPQNLGTRSQYASAAIGTGARVNNESVAGVDLRGLGIGTTLVLLNGRRLGLSDGGRTVDVSMIPVGAIERVEVLTDGASAIYGSDAIGGVVNFILRDDYEGAESQLRYATVTNGGLHQFNAAQIFGHAWGSGNALLAYNYFSASPLDVTDRDYAAAADRGMLSPDDERHNLLATFSQELTDRLVIGGDIAYSVRDVTRDSSFVRFANPLDWQLSTVRDSTEQIFANFAVDYDISPTLHGSFKATYGTSHVDEDITSVRYKRTPPSLVSTSNRERDYSGLDLTGMLDGVLFMLPGGDARFSAGGGIFDEDYTARISTTSTGTLARRTSYAFGELFLPLIGGEQNVPLVHRLELSMAARYTRYDDQSEPALHQEFGDGIDPKFGLLWAPADELAFRGTYGTSFRAPSLVQLDESSSIFQVFEPVRIPSPSGPNGTLIFLLQRPVGELGPETATTYTLGFDFRVPDRSSLRVSGTYYNVSYDNRIAQAPTGGGAYLTTPALYPLVIYHPPSAAFIEEQIRASRRLSTIPADVNSSDPAAAAQTLFNRSNVWIADFRTRNLAVSDQDGVDLSISDSFETSWGTMRYGADATYVLSYRQQAAPSELVVTLVDRATQPVDLRGRAYVGTSWGGFDGTVTVNYVDDYFNNFVSFAGATKIESWTTVDVSLSYDFGDKSSALLDGLRLNLSVQNLLDQDPPSVAGGAAEALLEPVGFDPANANPLGRFVAVGLTKRW